MDEYDEVVIEQLESRIDDLEGQIIRMKTSNADLVLVQHELAEKNTAQNKLITTMLSVLTDVLELDDIEDEFAKRKDGNDG